MLEAIYNMSKEVFKRDFSEEINEWPKSSSVFGGVTRIDE